MAYIMYIADDVLFHIGGHSGRSRAGEGGGAYWTLKRVHMLPAMLKSMLIPLQQSEI